MTQSATIHIVEPTLQNQTGHCYSHVLSLLKANRGLNCKLEIWAGKQAADLLEDTADCRVHAHFSRTFRRLQTLFLYRRLLRSPGRIYLPTGTRRDLVMFNLAAKGAIPANKVFMLFHWLKLNDRKRRHMEKIATKHPEIVTMAPTDGIVKLLHSCGFRQAEVIPYPITPVSNNAVTAQTESPFRYLLFAGAARADKGFNHVVELVRLLKQRNASMPVLVQSSPPHTGVHEPAVATALAELEKIEYPHLILNQETLNDQAYFGLFPGAVSLQLYDPQEYASDRISGVTLDALSCGSPLIATAGTWMAKIAERFSAGSTISDLSPASILAAATEIRDNFSTYREHALQAGDTLQNENDAGKILQRVLGE